MQESSPQGIRPGSPPPPPAADQGAFALKRRFPGDTSAPAAEPAPASVVANKTDFRRLGLPLLVLMLVVGGIAYVAQNLPSWRAKNPSGKQFGKGPAAGTQVLVFPATREEDGRIVALWDANDSTYVLEIEQGSKGHYDFVCLNAADQPVEVGLQRKECDCSTVSFAVLGEGQNFDRKQPDRATMAKALPKGLAWQTLEPRDEKGVVLPAQRAGLVRVSWETRKSEGDMLNLPVLLWAQPEGVASKERQYYPLETLTVVVAPVQFERPAIHLGEIGARGAKTHFHCWSCTRSDPGVRLADRLDDPLFEWQLTPLTAKDCENLEKRLNGSKKYRPTRVTSALRVDVTVHESKDGRQLDQGSFIRTAPLLLDDKQIETGATRVEGSVRGDVHIAGQVHNGSLGDGQVRFGTFKSSAGTWAELQLSIPSDTTLEYDDKNGKNPPYLGVRLTETKKGVDNKKIYHLKVVVPGQVPTGPLPADSAIILLRKTTQSATPRRIRIPLIGTAVQG